MMSLAFRHQVLSIRVGHPVLLSEPNQSPFLVTGFYGPSQSWRTGRVHVLLAFACGFDCR